MNNSDLKVRFSKKTEQQVLQTGKQMNLYYTDEYVRWLEDKVLQQANGVNTEQKALHVDSVMPRRLTAENGAKALLCGEFNETIVCHDDEGEPYEVKMPVEWDTIKRIYAKIVEHYEA